MSQTLSHTFSLISFFLFCDPSTEKFVILTGWLDNEFGHVKAIKENSILFGLLYYIEALYV